MAKIIDGKKISRTIREEIREEVAFMAAESEIREEVARLKAKTGRVPGLAVIMVGNDPASQVYVRMKEKACKKAGIHSYEFLLPEDSEQKKLLALIASLNQDPKVNGILVQLPLPDSIDEDEIISSVSPAKDVDCFHPFNVGKLLQGEPAFLPCTPRGIITLLEKSGIDPEEKEVVIVGRSNIVGKPLAAMLIQKQAGANATVTVCHTRTRDIASHTRRADILIAACGRPKTITTDMVKHGATVIDVGVNTVGRTDSGKRKLAGDVDFEGVSRKAGAITPVPGGVGPMTIAMLLKNTLQAFKDQDEG